MTLTTAITFLKDAVERSTPGGATSRYTFHDGMAYVTSAAIIAAHPVALDGTFALGAVDLDAALSRFDGEPTISAGEGTIILRNGRLRSSLQLLPAEPPTTITSVDDMQPVPPNLMPALKFAASFISKEGTWQRGVHLKSDCATAFNNRSAIEVQVDGLGGDVDMILSDSAAGYLPSLPLPSGWSTALPGAILFNWPNGAWVRCQLINISWPEVADRVMTKAGDVAPVAITEVWREAVDHLAVMAGDGIVLVTPDALRGIGAFSKSKVKMSTDVAKETAWLASELKTVFTVADAWNPDADGPARFTGPGLRGVVMRQQRR